MTIKINTLRWHAKLSTSLITLCLLICLVSLGKWQLRRANHKEQLHNTFYNPTHTQLRSANLLQSHPLKQLHYQRVTLHGYFQNDKTFLQDNRIYHGKVGFYIFTPFYETKIHHWLIINRGFLPRLTNKARLNKYFIPTIHSPGSIHIIINSYPQESILLGKNSEIMSDGKLLIQDLRFPELDHLLKLPFLHAIGLLIWPHEYFSINWKPNITISPARHRAYAFQWFSMASILVIIYCALNVTIRKPVCR